MTKKICGIYIIRNKTSGMVYVGQSIDVKKRFHQHKNSLDQNLHKCTHLQHSWQKHNPEDFEFVLIEECDRDKLNYQEWVNWLVYDMVMGTYNLSPPNPFKQCVVASTETRARMRESQRIWFANNPPRSHTQEEKDKISKANKGQTWTPEQYQRFLASHLISYPCTESTKVKRGKPIHQIDPNTKQIINTFRSSAEAGKHIGRSSTSILKCCISAKRHRHVGGYIWKFAIYTGTLLDFYETYKDIEIKGKVSNE